MTPAEVRAKRRDIKMRDKFQKMISGWLQEHIVFSLGNHSKYSAVDMAWDSLPINHAIVPLMQYAQGRMDLARVEKVMGDVPNSDRYLRRDKDGKVIGVELPKFHEVNINLIRSVLTRRLAAQAVKYDELWPYFKYEARDQTQVGKLRADAVSQRIDIMADQYQYRHFNTQVMRDMFMYGHSVAFPRTAWEREVQLVRSTSELPGANGGIKAEAKIMKEGLSWVTPHPSRLFYDNAYPLSSLNEDNGCEYVGFWDVCRWGDIANNGAYFNRRNVSYTSGMVDWFSTYWAYFNQYFTTIRPPSLPQAAGDNVTMMNDRKNQVGLFTGQMEQVSTIFTHLWVKVRPSNWGWGKYPHLVWVHLKVAGDATVVYARICPSSPAAVFSYNENDSRLMNISLAHEVMPFQDQLTNLFSQLLETVKQDLFSVCVLNTDVFPDTGEGRAARDEFEALMRNKALYSSTQMLEVSFSKLTQLGIKPSEAFIVVRSTPNEHITQIFEAISRVIAMANQLQVMSPQEQGQQASHEMSAHESQNIAQSTDTVYDFIGTAVDEGRAAMKRICYESLIACGTDEVELTVQNRYPNDIIQKAGFSIKDPTQVANGMTGYVSVMGSKHDLVHDYCFTSRDGANRPGGAQGAQTLVQLVQAIGGLQPEIQNAILEAMGKSKVFELFNSIFRMTDAGVDLNLELKAGESDQLTLSSDQQVLQGIQQLGQKLAQEVQQTTTMHQAIQIIMQFIGQTNPQVAAMVAQTLQSGAAPGANGLPAQQQQQIAPPQQSPA